MWSSLQNNTISSITKCIGLHCYAMNTDSLFLSLSLSRPYPSPALLLLIDIFNFKIEIFLTVISAYVPIETSARNFYSKVEIDGKNCTALPLPLLCAATLSNAFQNRERTPSNTRRVIYPLANHKPLG